MEIDRFKPILTLHKEALENTALMKMAKKAAVSVIIHNINSPEPSILLIKRNEYEGHHSGQMAFPGGKMDHTDLNLAETAIRESYEEIGVKLEKAYLKELEPIWVKVSNFIIYPYLTFVDKKLEFDINKREINRIFEIPVSQFKEAKYLKAHQISIQGTDYWSPYFEFEGEIIWGATALILFQNIFLKDALS
jgi:8-oxo-dGTP pyrophosphatase MutT (NUDIX family)